MVLFVLCKLFFKRARADFGRTLHLVPYFICATIEGSGETAWMHRLARAFAGRLCDKYHNLMSWLKYPCYRSKFAGLPLSSFCTQTFKHSSFGLILCFHSSTIYEPPHDKTNKMACAPSEDSDQPGHPPTLIRVFAVRMKKAWVLRYPLSAQRGL